MAGLRERLDDLLGGRGERAWSGSVEDLLYDGERVESAVETGAGRVVVTGHRVLAFTPESDGANFRGVDRPNVTGVRLGAEGDDDLLYRGVRTGLYGAVLLAVGVLVDFGSLLPTTSIDASGAGRVGVGGMLSTMNRFLALFAQLDDLLRLFGALALFLSAVMLGVYLLTRDRVIAVGVAGDEPDIHVPAPDDGDRRETVVEELDAALFGGEPGKPGSTRDRGPASGRPDEDDGDAGGDRGGDARFKSDGPL